MNTLNPNNEQYFDALEFAAELCDSRVFSVFHINIRSFNKNADELSIFLSQLPTKPSVIVLSETWFSCNNNADLVGYRSVHVYRDERRGGGISVFTKISMSSIPICELCYVGANMEICSISLNLSNIRIAVIGIYRPPNGSLPLFFGELNNILSECNPGDRVFLLGDLNVDLLNPSVCESELIDVCSSNSFLPLITSPTRLSQYSVSCIDHIWFNQLEETVAGVLKLDISDHFAVFAAIKLQNPNSDIIVKKFRDHSESCIRLLRTRVSAFVGDFDALRDGDGGDVSCETQRFCVGLYDVYNVCCPLRSKAVSVSRMLKPWINRDLINCVNRKHMLFKLYRRGEVCFSVYNSFKNILTSVIRKAKARYFMSKFSSGFGDAKETWKNINKLFNKRRTKEIVREIVSNGVEVQDRQVIADTFIEYFSNIGVQLDRNIPCAQSSPLDFMGASSPNSIFIQPSLPAEITSIVHSLPTKSSNFNAVPVFIFKQIIDIVSPVISNLFNRSINTGVFPDCLKLARVVPIYKSGDRCNTNNYRPISILPVLSKVFEKIMFIRLQSFIKSNNLLNDHQFGFREKSSTSDAVSQFLDFVFESFNAKISLLAVFLDFSKAFDTVNHQILCTKLHHMGFRGVALEWFRSYLANRKQFVDIGGTFSQSSEVRMGVPQGSVLGPVLFLLYINDMHRAPRNLNLVHFADDTTVFHFHENVDILTREVNSGLDQLNVWFRVNRLSLNVSKTSYMLFTDGNLIVDPVVSISGRVLQRVKESKFLGIWLDEKLSFAQHIGTLCKSVSQVVGMLNRFSSSVPCATKVSIYYSLIFSRISYGIVVWGFGSAVLLDKLDRIIGKAHKIVNYSIPTQMLTSKLFNVRSTHKYFTAVKFYKSVRLDFHRYFSEIFHALRPSHNYGTRFSELNYNVPQYSKTKCNKSFAYQSISVWNSLSDSVKQCNTLSLFKKRLKLELLERQ